jgi:ribosomal protein S18 acetylase RimI-like enzyme
MIKIRKLKKGEESQVKKIVKPTFDKQVAYSMTEEGIKEVYRIIQPEDIKERLKDYKNRFILVAEDTEKKKLVGVIEGRDFDHISVFFVDIKYQKQGIGRKLVEKMISICRKNNPDLKKITVNSSINAVSAYEKLGFVKVGKGIVKEKNGIRFVQMKLVSHERC